MSSVASLNEPSSNEPNFRPAVSVSTWNTPRQAASWDMGNAVIPNSDMESPQKKDSIQMASCSNNKPRYRILTSILQENHSPNHAYGLQQARQRQATAAQAAALSGPRIVSLGHEDERRLLEDGGERPPKAAPFSPQRFDGNAAKATSPTRSNGYIAPFTTPSNSQPAHVAASQVSYESSQSGLNVDELALGVRGMVVEDDHVSNPGGTHYRPQHSHHVQAVPPINGFNVPQIRPPPLPPTRPPYGPYPQEYSTYYPANAPSRESFPIEYPYAYDSYRSPSDPNLYGSGAPSSVTPSPGGLYQPVTGQPIHPSHDMHHRNPSGVFYEYNGAARGSGSQYFYSPHQPMVYHPPTHTGIPNPQLATVAVGNLTENKKRELQVCILLLLIICLLIM